MLIATIKEKGKIELLAQQDDESQISFVARVHDCVDSNQYSINNVNFYMADKKIQINLPHKHTILTGE